ncbi:sensor histidine kinase [Arenimonas sp.]|uniref:sensor histidine kinase n=1 Tax=Arenimonas sp. TaxID=1872635 RepID=UPI002E353EC4|nr:sensor histidine kinase [Arenimonas sp.]HEX4852996.1 sensor histidine kinase [Arenimonas sp.]
MTAQDPGAELARLGREYADLVARLESNQARFQRLARAMYRVQEDERRRLARDLHDGLGQNLTALKHQLMLLQGSLDPAAPAGPRLADAIALCEQTLADTRQLSRLLRPQVLDDLGLVPALRWLGRTLAQPAGVSVEIEAGEVPELDEDTRTLVFRVAQEALTNSIRHAAAEHAGFRLGAERGRLRFEAWDDGRGFDAEHARQGGRSGEGSGLGAMRERAALHGGTLQLVTHPGAGTRLKLEVPLAGDAGRLTP